MNISTQTRNSYSEIYEVLKKIKEDEINKIPKDILETIKQNRNQQYIPNIDFDHINNSLSKKAQAIYIWLYLTYITNDPNEKTQIRKKLYENDANNSYNRDLFKKAEIKKEHKVENKLIEYKPNIIEKIIIKIKQIFSKK